MEDTKKTPEATGNASADEPAQIENTQALRKDRFEDDPTTHSGPHIHIRLSEQETATINEILKGMSLLDDDDVPAPLPSKSKSTHPRESEPVFMPYSDNGKLRKWQTMKFISAGNLKTIKDTETSNPLPPPLPPDGKTTSSKQGEYQFNHRRESFNSGPPPADLFPTPRKPKQQQADSGNGRKYRWNSKAKINKKGEAKKPEGGAVGGTSGFTDPFPLKFNPLTSKVMDMNAPEDFMRCSEKCGQCGHCDESFNY